VTVIVGGNGVPAVALGVSVMVGLPSGVTVIVGGNGVPAVALGVSDGVGVIEAVGVGVIEAVLVGVGVAAIGWQSIRGKVRPFVGSVTRMVEVSNRSSI
jgi:hypothetical protein